MDAHFALNTLIITCWTKEPTLNELKAKRQTKCKQCLHFITQGLVLYTRCENVTLPLKLQDQQRGPFWDLAVTWTSCIYVIIFKKFFATIFVWMIAVSKFIALSVVTLESKLGRVVWPNWNLSRLSMKSHAQTVMSCITLKYLSNAYRVIIYF